VRVAALRRADECVRAYTNGAFSLPANLLKSRERNTAGVPVFVQPWSTFIRTFFLK